ncbi:uncharacterized protein [Primulina eburnea]|uniref:uncharacterized protein n=1 Tax=Primulina eburnea TaxID=1245227 RepID=UPI003C6CB2A5
MPSLVYLVIYLCLHACAARPLVVLDSVSPVQGLNGIEPEAFVARGNVIAEYGGKISDGTTAIQLENQRTSAVEGTEGTAGSPSVKILCSRKNCQRRLKERYGRDLNGQH